MPLIRPEDFIELYAGFQSPIARLNCGEKCAPYNERGVPFCCDTHHTVPTVYQEEWEFLQINTDLWHPLTSEQETHAEVLRAQLPDGQVLVACLGHTHCQRGYRSITCRSFPFFPYFSLAGEFLGLSYYWEFEDRCWVISHLDVVSPDYRAEFIQTFDSIFEKLPQERDNFRQHSIRMRQHFGRMHRAIPLLHRNGYDYKITPRNGRLRRIAIDRLPLFGPYRIAERLPFPDEKPYQ
jgi:hypothetical protein